MREWFFPSSGPALSARVLRPWSLKIKALRHQVPGQLTPYCPLSQAPMQTSSTHHRPPLTPSPSISQPLHFSAHSQFSRQPLSSLRVYSSTFLICDLTNCYDRCFLNGSWPGASPRLLLVTPLSPAQPSLRFTLSVPPLMPRSKILTRYDKP